MKYDENKGYRSIFVYILVIECKQLQADPILLVIMLGA
jgi:hypothetical protein